jgi:hypothetical protein
MIRVANQKECFGLAFGTHEKVRKADKSITWKPEEEIPHAIVRSKQEWSINMDL